MVFNVSKISNNNISNLYSNCLSEVRKFYNYADSKYPVLFTVESRKEMDFLFGDKTEDWFVGFSRSDFIFVFSPEVYEKVSVHKYSKSEYESLIKHEISHFYYDLYSGTDNPLWLNEGLAYFIANQVKYFNQPEKFSKFLGYYDRFNENSYKESSHAVSLLIKNFGKNKVTNLIKSFRNKELSDKKVFEKEFEDIYKSKPTYNFFNTLFKN